MSSVIWRCSHSGLLCALLNDKVRCLHRGEETFRRRTLLHPLLGERAGVRARVNLTSQRNGMTMNRNRVFSIFVAVFYFIVAYTASGAETAFKAVLVVILPLACIWFPEQLGGYLGPAGSSTITATSPAILIRTLGWVLLFLPLILWIVPALAGSNS